MVTGSATQKYYFIFEPSLKSIFIAKLFVNENF
jgi:hypothetical protein